MSRKLRVVRVITVPFVVECHLPNILRNMPADFELCVVGQDVTQFKDAYPETKWVDINIERKIRPVADLAALFALCKFFAAYKPDIVHSLMPKAGLFTAIAGFVCRVPVRIHTFTGQVWATKKGLARTVLRCADRLVNTLNTVCLTDGPSQSEFLHNNNISYEGKPLPVLSQGSLSGVDVARFNVDRLAAPANDLRASLGIESEHFVFAFIARKTRDKGALDVLNAFSAVSRRFKQARLLFVGPDEDGTIETLRKVSPELFLNVVEVGYVSNHEVFLAISDVLCLPSYREGFSTIVIDAAAMAVPAIGSRIPGVTDPIIDNETGFLFPAGDLSELVRLMEIFVQTPRLRVEMGVRARARVEEFFTADRLYVALKDFYRSCAADRCMVPG